MIYPGANLFEEHNKEVEVRIVTLKHRNENFIDNDFQSMLRPLSLMQKICFSTKCDIKENVITNKSASSKRISLAGNAVFSIICIYKAYSAEAIVNENLSFALLFSLYFNVITNIVGVCLNFIASVKNSENYIEFISKINKVNRTNNNKKFIENTRKRNWFFLVVYIALTYILVAIFGVFLNRSVGDLLLTIVACTFDINILVANGFIHLLKMQLLFWVTKVKTLADRSLTEDLIFDVKRIQLLKSWLDMTAAFNLYKKIFQVPVKF